MAAPLGGSIAVNSFVDSAGPNQPFFAPASGGGGGSGTSTFNQLFVSTIGTTSPGNVDLAILAGGANLVFDAPINGQLLDLQFQVSTVIANGGNAPSISCFDLGGTYLMSIGAPAGVGMTTSISTLNVSSINGASPGGGGSVPANLVTSSIQALTGGDDLVFEGQNGTIVCDQNGDGQALIFQQNPGNAEIRLINGSSLLKLGGQPGQGEVPVSISSLTVANINGAPYAPGGGGAPPAIVSTISSLVNVSTINSGSPGILNVLGGLVVSDNIGTGTISTIRVDPLNPGSAVTISSLNVALLNGSPPATGGAQFSSIGIPGGAGASTFQLTQGSTNLLVSFSTIVGHSYSASVGARAQLNTVPGDTDIIYSEMVDDGVGNEVIGLWPLSQVSTFSAVFNQEVGGTVNWKAGGTGVAFSLYPTAPGATARVDRLVVIDFGAI